MPKPSGTRALICLSLSGTVADALDQLAARGWRCHEARDAQAARAVLVRDPRARFAGIVALDPRRGEEQLERLSSVLADPRVGWVALIEPDHVETPWVRRLIHGYCHDYVCLPCPAEVLATVLGHAHGMVALAPEPLAGPAGGDFEGMVGDSPAMRALFRGLQKAAMTEAPIFLAGETGTGKELAALAVHRRSRRHAGPFVAINCGAIPQGLVQSELFGFERGAFTGAVQRKPGRIETAHGGTLLLDEIGDLPMDSQATLLRFLEQGTIERIGGREPVAVDVRIVSATHVDLAAAVAQGRFRADLYHRLCVIELRVPPLRERGDDIVRIAEHALARYAGEGGRRLRGFSPRALRAIRAHDWPGNVRELLNRVRQAVVMAEGRRIAVHDLRLHDPESDHAPATLEQSRHSNEREALVRALARNGHRLAATARDLGISRVTLYRLMLRHDLRATRTDDAA
jgi:DNA-binding NtrC family response regulator